VTGLLAVLELDAEQPRTVVAFAHHESSMTRGPDSMPKCAACAKPFDAYGSATRRHCSRECRMTLAEPIVCPSCGESFKRRSGNQKYCSVLCRARATQRTNTCEVCGKRLSRAGYKLCRACWAARGRAA
jgi:predicted amidophosphoribosyltransferase